MKPRSDVVVRRFLAGESVSMLAQMCTGGTYGLALTYVEDCIRRALNKKEKR